MNINVRFPESVRDRVKQLAEQDRRSMNSEIIELLEEAIAARDRKASSYAYPMAGDVATARLIRAADEPATYAVKPRRPRPPAAE